MKIIANGIEIPIIDTLMRNEYIGTDRKEIVEIMTNEQLTQEQIQALSEDPQWKVIYGDDMEETYEYYNIPSRHSFWLIQRNADAELVAIKEQEIATLNTERTQLQEEKEILVVEKETIVAEKAAVLEEKRAMKVSAISFLRSIEPNDAIIGLSDLLDEWQLDGEYECGDPVKRTIAGIIRYYTAIQNHPALNDQNRAPENAPALWAIYHAKSAQYALPWVAPTHAEDIYKIGEWMIWVDGKKYEAIANTDQGPDVLPNNWRVEEASENPSEPEPEEPEDLNSNGTAVWSEWKAWESGLNSDLYQIGDRVTQDELRYIATLGNNHYEPASGTGWQLA